ncbi:hypothetical protein SAMN06298226_2455 [Nitrosovibrio sp. Nv4]|nr:hypothetical protein SAMN06298226_2455 [Nitrosovibrio sp. Nv4]
MSITVRGDSQRTIEKPEIEKTGINGEKYRLIPMKGNEAGTMPFSYRKAGQMVEQDR